MNVIDKELYRRRPPDLKIHLQVIKSTMFIPPLISQLGTERERNLFAVADAGDDTADNADYPGCKTEVLDSGGRHGRMEGGEMRK